MSLGLPQIQLNSGHSIPALAFGTGGKRDPTAQNDPRQALLDALQEDTQPYSLQAAWSIMENLKQEGLRKDIGLSNFGASDIATLSQSWTFVPAMNQIELSPHCAHDPRTSAIVDICAKHHITPMAYSSLSPLRTPREHFPDDPGAPQSTCPISSGFEEGQPLRPLLHRIGSQRGGMTETQVLLAWTWQVFRGCIVTTTDKRWRMGEYLRTFDHAPLTQEELDSISKVGETKYYRRYPRALA
ncbi:hypothetical protein I316_05165 [Kwoniella heveanensis BCC8398]|uniref:NADP-dependent oxidoreductase domain-containing protein n=1 Tax=Kwoniella heveanensis BCC8398 TaxID=1296120 RepID=A0A1B9GPX2_9TREE|nr:hypothetical protein I316_05165 [Kwoniella heveanensis BCC8398]